MSALRSEDGILPSPGGFYDQASTFCDSFEAAKNEVARWKQKLQDRAQTAANNKSKR